MRSLLRRRALLPVLLSIPLLMQAQGIIIQPGAFVTVQSGADIKTSGSAKLKITSTASGTGSLVDYNTNGNITIDGTTAVERYVANDYRWHFLSSPTAAPAVWPEFAPEPTGSPLTFASPYNWEFFYFNPNCPAGGLSWVNLRKTGGQYNVATVDEASSVAGFGATSPPTFTTGRGYLVAYNTDWVTGSPTVHTFGNAVNTGAVSRSVIYSTTGSVFNLVGNPYPCSVDWKAASGWDRSALAESGTSAYDYWVWNDSDGNYGVFNSGGTTGTHSVTQYIACGQAFFVKAASNGSLGMANAVRMHSSQAWLKEREAEPNLIRLRITNTVNQYNDEMIVEFNNQVPGGGSEKFFTMYNEAPEMWSVKEMKNYSIDRNHDMVQGLTIPVSVRCGVQDTYTITATNIDEFTFSRIVYLEDLKTGSKVDLKVVKSYTFTGDPADARERFRLIFSEPSGVGEEPSTPPFYVYAAGRDLMLKTASPLTEAADIYVFDVIGRMIFQTHPPAGTNGGTLMTFPAPGTYLVRAVAPSGGFTVKLVAP